MKSECIEQRNGGYYVAGTRISLESVAIAHSNGDTPAKILENYPFLEKLSRIYGALAFYLDNKSALDQHFAETLREFESRCIPLETANSELHARIERARAQIAENRI